MKKSQVNSLNFLDLIEKSYIFRIMNEEYKKIIATISKDFRNFLDHFFLLKSNRPDFYYHYYRSAIIASKVGYKSDLFRDTVKNRFLYDATLYCDVGLSEEVKMGCRISPDEKTTKLKDHIELSMRILGGGNFFFKNSILLIAWHHWQPDGNGYIPEALPALNLYKQGGNIIALSTAFDSIFTRHYAKTNDVTYALSYALGVIRQNLGKQFVEIYYHLLRDLLHEGLLLLFGAKRIKLLLNQKAEKIVDYFVETGVFDYKRYKNLSFNDTAVPEKNAENFDLFQSLYEKGIAGELYNIRDISNAMDKLIKIISHNINNFNSLFLKLVAFLAQFKYPDGELKSFVKESFFKYIENYFSSDDLSVELLMDKIIKLWVAYLDNKFTEEENQLFYTYMQSFFTLISNIKKRYQFSNSYLPAEIRNKTKSFMEEISLKIREIYDPKEIDETKKKVVYLKSFLNIWSTT